MNSKKKFKYLQQRHGVYCCWVNLHVNNYSVSALHKKKLEYESKNEPTVSLYTNYKYTSPSVYFFSPAISIYI